MPAACVSGKGRAKAKAATGCRWSVEPMPENAGATVYVDVPKCDAVFPIMLSGDRHHDDPTNDARLETEHLEYIRDRGGCVVDLGDLFNLTGGKHDKRATKESLRAEDSADDYIDRVINNVVRFYKPFAPQFAVIGTGNHESAILKHLETNPSARFVRKLNEAGSPAVRCGYRFWVRLQFTVNKTRRFSLDMYCVHGSGGMARKTKGTLKIETRQNDQRADIYVSGHLHTPWAIPQVQREITIQGRERQRRVWHIQVPSYKRDGGKYNGWAVEKEFPALPVGCVILNCSFRDAGINVNPQYMIEG